MPRCCSLGLVWPLLRAPPTHCCAAAAAALLPAFLPARRDYSKLLQSKGERGVTVRRCETVEEVLRESHVSAALAWRMIADLAVLPAGMSDSGLTCLLLCGAICCLFCCAVRLGFLRFAAVPAAYIPMLPPHASTTHTRRWSACTATWTPTRGTS
jgi:hypothetical protein